MEAVTLLTDARGQRLGQPLSLLLASPSDWNENKAAGRVATVWSRNTAGHWIKSEIERGSTDEQGLSARAMSDHVDAVTGIHHVFAGVHNGLAGGRIYRGAYDPTAPQRLEWDRHPEIDHLGGRVTAFAQANGVLYATAGLAGNGDGVVEGGLYRRVDGVAPRWERVWQWPYQADAPRMAADEWNNLRGLTAVPDPAGGKHTVLIAAHAYSGNIYRIDPKRGHAVEVEFNVRRYFAKTWGVTYEAGRKPAVTAHNQFTPFHHPDSGEALWLVDCWVERNMIRRTYPENLAYYFVRRQNGSYAAHGVIDDPRQPVPDGSSLGGTRTIEPSPFPEDRGRVLYFGGYDVTAIRGAEHNTAWIYRGLLS
jgi:hypothetical protein